MCVSACVSMCVGELQNLNYNSLLENPGYGPEGVYFLHKLFRRGGGGGGGATVFCRQKLGI